jgi:hypothetical protein
MKAIKFSLIAGALLAATGAAAQPAQIGAQGRRGPAAEVTRDQAVARAEQRFARLDANRDGRVTAEEARQAVQAGMQQRQQRRAERQGQRQGQAFDRLDTDRNGSISREEFAQRRALRDEPGQRGGRGGMRGMGLGGERMGQRMFGEDGMITRDEFRARALQRFERLDANRDGRVTLAERREVRQRLREERRGRRQAPAQN